METLTNILDYQINREAIDKDFCVVCFRFEDKLNPRVLDNPEVNVKSIYYTKCKAYALMHHDDYDNLYYCDELKKNNITYEKMNINDVFDPVLIQLFLNTLTNLAGNYNNLTGKYCKMLSKDNDKSTKIKNTKRIVLSFTVNEEKNIFYKGSKSITLNVSATTFIKSDSKSSNEPLYIIGGNNKTLRRVFHKTDEPCYEQPKNKKSKTTYHFFKISDKSGRAKEMVDVLNLMNKNYAKYFNKLTFKKIDIIKRLYNKKKTLEFDTLELIKNFDINIVNKVSDLLYAESVCDFVKNLKAFGLKVSHTNKLNKKKFNIVLAYDADYYDDFNLEDPHDEINADVVKQHIVISNLDKLFISDNTGKLKPTPLLITIFKELLIKYDIISNQNKFSFVDWSSYNFKNQYKFIYRPKDSDDLYNMIIEPNGNYKIFKEHVDLFNSYENDNIKKLFKGNNNVRLVIIDDDGNINSIEYTSVFTMPSLELFDKEVITRDVFMRENFYPGLCDINFYDLNGINYYNVGVIGSGMNRQIANASHLYRVNCINNSKSIIENILSTMSVNFVRYNESTVLPFPIKYLREYAKIHNK